MSSLNQFKQSVLNGPKLSMLYIEQAYFYRIQIKSLANMYKLNIRIKKPIILSLYSLPVLKYIIDHSQSLNSILQMENIHQIKLSVPGYGIFNQKYQLQRISNLFQIFASYCQHISVSIKKITLQFPGWRAFTDQIINSIFKFIRNCETLQQFSLNFNHNMNLSANRAISDDEVNLRQMQQQTFYGKYMFETPQFDNLMKSIYKYLPVNTMSKIQLRFGAWQAVSNSIIQILIDSIKKIYQTMKYVKIMKLDIHGWGTGNYDSTDRQIKYDSIQKLFRTIQQFDGETSQLLQVDMRYWPSKFKISKFKQRFQYLSGGIKRKDENTSSMGGWTMTGTNFFGSQMKGKLMNRMKIEIKD